MMCRARRTTITDEESRGIRGQETEMIADVI